jgi:hypothetical protein
LLFIDNLAHIFKTDDYLFLVLYDILHDDDVDTRFSKVNCCPLMSAGASAQGSLAAKKMEIPTESRRDPDNNTQEILTPCVKNCLNSRPD